MQQQPGCPLRIHHWLSIRVERGRHGVTKVGTADPGGGWRRTERCSEAQICRLLHTLLTRSLYFPTDPHSGLLLSNPQSSDFGKAWDETHRPMLPGIPWKWKKPDPTPHFSPHLQKYSRFNCLLGSDHTSLPFIPEPRHHSFYQVSGSTQAHCHAGCLSKCSYLSMTFKKRTSELDRVFQRWPDNLRKQQGNGLP